MTSNSIKVLVNPLPDTVSIIGPTVVCRNQSDVYYKVSSHNFVTKHYSWNLIFGSVQSGFTSFETLINFNNQPGVDTVYFLQTFNTTGCKNTMKKPITILNNLAPLKTQIIRKPNSNILICADTAAYIKYKWGFTDKITMADYLIPGGNLRYVQLPHTIDTNIYHYFVITYFDYNAYSCETRTEYNRNTVITGVNANSLEYSNFSFYPNPNNGYIKLVNFTNTDKIRIFDLTGNLVNYTLANDILTFGDNLSSGVYIMELTTLNEIMNFKIVFSRW